MPPSLSATSAHDVRKTSSSGPQSKKKARELKLRADALVEVLGPTLVRCLNCGAEIKLSPKSDYDASHWTRHRGRCLKKSKAHETPRKTRVVVPVQVQVQSVPDSSSGTSSTSSREVTPQEEGKIASPPDYMSWKSWDWSQLRSSFLPHLNSP
ncbi:hypothetical protein C8F01DRAFT_703932 [Mycena amicta]|nr:hypothetical protein C8F01DRAFT_703932 [Mycena amicta]